MEQSLLGWVLASVLILGALALDLFIFNRRTHAIEVKEALLASAGWIALAMAFNVGVLYTRGSGPALEFLTGYLIELSLSVDNLFVFLLLFRYFSVPGAFQHKVLFWGILGAVVMRLAFIFAGVALLERFHWALYVFGAILILSGIRMGTGRDVDVHPERNPVLLFARRFFRVSSTHEGDRFFVRQGGRLFATPLFLVLLVVETTDLVFAVDSIPAVLAITKDPFIVFTSNIFAILGLRALFFSLARAMQLFHALHYGLAVILVFVGSKMILSNVWHVPTPIALGVIAGVLAICVIVSVLHPRPATTTDPPSGPPASPPAA